MYGTPIKVLFRDYIGDLGVKVKGLCRGLLWGLVRGILGKDLRGWVTQWNGAAARV